MPKKLELTDQNCTCGSYLRADFKEDVLYSFYQYQDVSMTFSEKTGMPHLLSSDAAIAAQKGEKSISAPLLLIEI